MVNDFMMSVADCQEAQCPGADDVVRCAAIKNCPICAAEVSCPTSRKAKAKE